MTFRLSLLTLLLAVTILITSGQTSAKEGLKICHEHRAGEGIDLLEKAVKSEAGSSDAEILSCLSIGYLSKNDTSKATKYAEKAVEINPSVSTYQSNLAYLYLLSNKNSKAREAAKKSVLLDSKNALAYYFMGTADYREWKLDDAERNTSSSIIIEPKFADAYVLAANILLGRLSLLAANGYVSGNKALQLLDDAKNLLAMGKERCKGQPGVAEIDNEFGTVFAFYDHFNRQKDDVILPAGAASEPGVEDLKILAKPRPSYTDDARMRNIQGTIVLAVLFGKNGKVEQILPIKRLGGGLDQQAVSAARKIKFEPRKKDGQPVDVVKTIEYTFSIY